MLACRALEYAQIVSRFVRLDGCEIILVPHFMSWVLCAISAIRERSAFSQMLAVEKAGINLAREMHVTGICAMFRRNVDSLYQTRHEISLSSAGRLRRASDDAASA